MRTGLAGAAAAEFNARFEAVERRLRDPQLYLAVIGEFSSGKSTFINALIGDDVLAASVIPTTSTATHIRAGESLTVTLVIEGHQLSFGLAGDRPSLPATLVELLRRLAPDETLPRTLPSLMTLLTTHPAISDAVTHLEVRHPAPVLAEGLTLIDTPGTNAGCPRHVEVTRQVMAHVADLAVVTISAHAPVDETLVAFLSEALAPDQIQGCVFVVTRMDDVDRGAQDQLLDAVRQRLLTRLALPSATVLGAAPACVVHQVRGRQPAGAEIEWSQRFERLRARLLAVIRARRQIAVALSVLRLADDALTMVQRGLDARRSALADRSRSLDTVPIRKLDVFLDEQLRRHRAALRRSGQREGSRASQLVDTGEEELRQAAFGALDAASSKRELANAMKQRIPSLFEAHRKRLEPELRDLIGPEPAAVVRQALIRLDEDVVEGYRQLQQVVPLPLPKRRALAAVPAAALQAGAGTSVSNVTASFGSGPRGFKVAGAGTGAVIGSLVAGPGVGTLLGGLIGWGVGALFGPSIDDLRAQCRSHVASAIGAFFEGVRSEVGRVLQQQEAQLAKVLEERCGAYHTAYAPIVAAAIEGHTAERNALASEWRRLDADIAGLRSRRDAVEEVRRQLARLLDAPLSARTS
jgi:hypothetical protein